MLCIPYGFQHFKTSIIPQVNFRLCIDQDHHAVVPIMCLYLYLSRLICSVLTLDHYLFLPPVLCLHPDHPLFPLWNILHLDHPVFAILLWFFSWPSPLICGCIELSLVHTLLFCVFVAPWIQGLYPAIHFLS
jgi:hypothetical protein